MCRRQCPAGGRLGITAIRAVCVERYLWDEREARAQVEQRHGGDVDAVDQDAAARRLHHALERHHQRALATAGAPRYPHLLAACNDDGVALVLLWA